MGISVLGVLALMIGLICLVSALGSFLVAGATDTRDVREAIGDGTPEFIVENAEIVFTSLGVIFLVLAVITLLFAYGLFKGSGWAWSLGIIVTIITIVMNSISIITNMSLSSIGSALFAILIAALILYYLTRPRVKGFFQ